jgi:hypothetical protein
VRVFTTYTPLAHIPIALSQVGVEERFRENRMAGQAVRSGPWSQTYEDIQRLSDGLGAYCCWRSPIV